MVIPAYILILNIWKNLELVPRYHQDVLEIVLENAQEMNHAPMTRSAATLDVIIYVYLQRSLHFKVSIILGLLLYCCDKTMTKRVYR